MSFAETAGLGAVAGFTIFLGLPIARLGRPSVAVMAFLNAVSIGVLLFLLYDVVSQASGTVDVALRGSRLRGSGYGVLFAAGLAVGLLGLVIFEKLGLRRQPRPAAARASGPGAMLATATDLATGAVAGGGEQSVNVRRPPLSAASRVALFIAIGIGLHNFSEGLAIGQSAAVGADTLFGVLVVGFGLHNITEGFGITGPLVGRERPTWGFLGLLGLIGGGPTFIGTLIGYQTTSAALSVLFLALAAGAIIYVVGELQHAGRRIGAHDVAMVGILVGFLVAYGTDKLLFVAGG